MIFGVDTGTPVTASDIAALKKQGVKFICRYISPGNWNDLRAGEGQLIHQAGLGLVLVFEAAADRALSGAVGGQADATAAREHTKALGIPSAPIYFAVDFDAQTDQLPAIVAYIKGAALVLGQAQTGVYGGLAVVKACMDARACRYAWQTLAWSGGVWDPRAQIQQYQINTTLAGHSVDLDHALTESYGQWASTVPKVIYEVDAAGHARESAVYGHGRLRKMLRGVNFLRTVRRFGSVRIRRRVSK